MIPPSTAPVPPKALALGIRALPTVFAAPPTLPAKSAAGFRSMGRLNTLRGSRYGCPLMFATRWPTRETVSPAVTGFTCCGRGVAPTRWGALVGGAPTRRDSARAGRLYSGRSGALAGGLPTRRDSARFGRFWMSPIPPARCGTLAAGCPSCARMSGPGAGCATGCARWGTPCGAG